VFETRGAAATAFARVLESSNNRYHIDLIARGRYGGGKVGVHDFRSAFPYGLDPQGQPYRFELSLRMMPREVAHNGDRINVVIYSYETREKEIVFFGSIVAINGRSVGIADPVLSRRG